MSFNGIQNGAIRGFVSTLGQNLAQFPFLFLPYVRGESQDIHAKAVVQGPFLNQSKF
jgi:hypothetical protein